MSVGSGLASGGLRYAEQVGAEAVQVFVGNPRAWALSPGVPDEDRALRSHVERTRLPVFVHAPYLVNVGSPNRETLRRSLAAIRHALARGYDVGARGVVVHTGSAVRPDRHAEAMRQVRDGLPDDGPDLLLEPMAGQGRMLCARAPDLSPYLDVLDYRPRAGVCLDTCHAFAAGHDLAAPGAVRALLETVRSCAGTGRLKLIHANDSADGCGSYRDRHANIGRGRIGERPFAELFGWPVTAGVPVIVETPGGIEAHRRDVDLLKKLRLKELRR